MPSSPRGPSSVRSATLAWRTATSSAATAAWGTYLCYLSHIRAYGLVPAQTRCTVVGAGVQDFNSQGGREAAHYLPGQLLLQLAGGAAVEPWTVVQNATTVWDYSEQTRALGHYLRFSEGSTLSDVLIRDVQGRFKP